MDISVRHLNNRMALQVPPELPLGLVFVVGWVRNLGPAETDAGDVPGHVRFELVDGAHRLRCTLPRNVAEETLLQEGDRVRVSGQLAFDPHVVRYLLFARDLEILADRSVPSSTYDGLADVRRRAHEANLAPPDLPPWVRQLAPPEVQVELGLLDEVPKPTEREMEEAPDSWDQAPSGRQSEMPEEMVAFLSALIDSEEETELTPEMIARYLPQKERPAGESAGRGQLASPAHGAQERGPQVGRAGTSVRGTRPLGAARAGEAVAAESLENVLWDLFILARVVAAWLWRFRMEIALAFLVLSLTAATVILVLLLRHSPLF